MNRSILFMTLLVGLYIFSGCSNPKEGQWYINKSNGRQSKVLKVLSNEQAVRYYRDKIEEIGTKFRNDYALYVNGLDKYEKGAGFYDMQKVEIANLITEHKADSVELERFINITLASGDNYVALDDRVILISFNTFSEEFKEVD